MTLKTKWIAFLYYLATGNQKIRNFFTPVGAIFYGLLIFSFIFVALQVDRSLGISPIFSRPLSVAAAVPLFFAALFLIGWSVLHFIKAKGTPVPANPPPRLVTDGPYSYVRNPMLTGVFLLLFGFGVLLGSVSLLAVFAPIFIALNVWELKAIEEPELLKRLGKDYTEYRKRTPMFFPVVGKMFGKGKQPARSK
jgi:protein-S-isoprenylcysteine O-methyltransferase Ste14